jgi:hypothetical protein
MEVDVEEQVLQQHSEFVPADQPGVVSVSSLRHCELLQWSGVSYPFARTQSGQWLLRANLIFVPLRTIHDGCVNEGY